MDGFGRSSKAVAELELPAAVFKTCPWQPRALIETGLRQWLRRTVIAWSLVALPGERCVLWDIDSKVGVDEPWGLAPERVAEIQAAVKSLSDGRSCYA